MLVVQGDGLMTTDIASVTSMLDSEFLERLEKCTNLPSPPVVALRILETLQDPDIDIGRVAEIISMDPALVTNILRIANSPIYAIRRKIENLRQAIILLGLDGTLAMALSFSLANSLHNNARQGFDYNLFWRRSLAVATCCRRFGVVVGLYSTEEMFLAGLLQDVGMLALDKLQPDFYKSLDVDQADHALLQQKEREHLGADHAVIGAWLMHKWQLPETFQYVLMGSHDLSLVDPDNVNMPYARFAMVSGLLVDALSLQDSEKDLEPVLQLVNEQTGVGLGVLTAMLETLNEDFIEMALLFETDLNDYGLSEALIDQVKESLMLRNVKLIRRSDRLLEKARDLEERTRALEERASRDGLTGLYNRAYLDKVIQQEFEMAKAHDWPLAIMVIDLDHFKHVNDTYGHQTGDDILVETARILSAGTRDEDVVVRYDGGEFVILLRGRGEMPARVLAERMVNTFRNTKHRVKGDGEIVVTASIGLALMGESNSFSDVRTLINAADMAVHEAKSKGRDCSVMYSGS